MHRANTTLKRSREEGMNQVSIQHHQTEIGALSLISLYAASGEILDTLYCVVMQYVPARRHRS